MKKRLNEWVTGEAALVDVNTPIKGTDIGIYDMVYYDPVSDSLIKNDKRIVGYLKEDMNIEPFKSLEDADFYKFEKNLLENNKEDINCNFYTIIGNKKYAVYVDTRIPRNEYSNATPLFDGNGFDEIVINKNSDKFVIFINDGIGYLYNRGEERVFENVTEIVSSGNLNSKKKYLLCKNNEKYVVLGRNIYGSDDWKVLIPFSDFIMHFAKNQSTFFLIREESTLRIVSCDGNGKTVNKRMDNGRGEKIQITHYLNNNGDEWNRTKLFDCSKDAYDMYVFATNNSEMSVRKSKTIYPKDYAIPSKTCAIGFMDMGKKKICCYSEGDEIYISLCTKSGDKYIEWKSLPIYKINNEKCSIDYIVKDSGLDIFGRGEDNSPNIILENLTKFLDERKQ